jgi:ERCC4-type nuclease
MKIVVDERERELYQALYAFLHSQMTPLPLQLEKETLTLGDISIRRDEDDKEWVLLERKTLKDLVASIKDGRYEEQSYRLTHSTPPDFQLHNICYLIEGPLNTIRNPIEKKMILGAIASLYFFKGFQVMRTSSVEDTAEWIITLALKIERGFAEKKLPWFIRWEPVPKSAPMPAVSTLPQQSQITHSPSSSNTEEENNDAQSHPHLQTEASILLLPQPEREPDKAYCSVVKRIKSANLTPDNIGEIFLCQIPTVGPETATAIMQKYQHSLPRLINALETEGPQSIDTLTTLDSKGHARKISKACVTNIQKYLLGNK